MTVEHDGQKDGWEAILTDRGVFDVDAYGWLNEDDVDPEFVGYAMWALTPPYEHDFEAWQDNTPPRRAPTDGERKLMELGHDFFGLMKTSRYFIGHALLHEPHVPALRIESTDFDFHEFAALVALTAAADRVSDFVIVTALGAKTNVEGERNKACDALRQAAMSAEADAMQEGFKAIAKARDARRLAVHGLATEPARVQQRLIKMDEEAFRNRRYREPGAWDVPFEDIAREQTAAEAQDLAELEARATLMCDCYVNLIKMGGLGFQIENEWRRRQKP